MLCFVADARGLRFRGDAFDLRNLRMNGRSASATGGCTTRRAITCGHGLFPAWSALSPSSGLPVLSAGQRNAEQQSLAPRHDAAGRPPWAVFDTSGRSKYRLNVVWATS